MRSATVRSGLLFLGLLFTMGQNCPRTERFCANGLDDDFDGLTDCEDPSCENDPACNSMFEICDDRVDNDADGDVDDQDRACVNASSPVTSVTCVRQDAATAAGGDADATLESDGCDETTHSASGEDRAEIAITALGRGVIEIAGAVAGGDDSSSTASVTATIRVDYERGGANVPVSLYAVTPGVEMAGTCHSVGYDVPIGFSTEAPTSPAGGSVECTVTVFASAEGGESKTFVVQVGSLLARDRDGDGKSDRNDLCNGCPNEGTFGPGGIYDYACAAGSTCAIGPDPNPEFCTNCFMGFGSVVASAGVNGSLLFDSATVVRIDDGQLRDSSNGWYLDGEFIEFDTESGQVRCTGDDCQFAGRGGEVFCDGSCQLLASRTALLSPDPQVAQVALATDDPNVDGQFGFTVSADGGPTEELTVATTGGVGSDEIIVLFKETATVEALPASGFETPSSDCPGANTPEGTFLASFNASTDCTITYDGLVLGDVGEIGVDGGETFVDVPDDFGPDGVDRFGVAGAGGLGAYTSSFSLIASLSEVGSPFGFRNLLFGLMVKAPAGANDSIFVGRTTGGAEQTAWFEELGGYGARQLSFGTFRSAQHRNGDSNSEEAIVVSNGGVDRLSFQDVGGGQIFLARRPYVLSTALPSGFTPWAAYWTNDSDEVLIAAQSTTPGANGRIFRASPTTGFGAATSVGDVGSGVRLMDCDQAVPPNWICISASFDGEANVIRWVPGVEAQIIGEIDTGANPLGVLAEADGANVNFAITNYGSNSFTIGTAAGDTGSVLTSESRPLPAGVVQPSDVTVLPGVLAVLARDESDPQQTVVVRVPLPW